MGLIRGLSRIMPYAGIFLIGYYVGTIKSGKHDEIFCTSPEHRLEWRMPSPEEQSLETTLKEGVHASGIEYPFTSHRKELASIPWKDTSMYPTPYHILAGGEGE